MTLATIEQVIQARLDDNWTATEIAWQNVDFITERQTAFVRVTFIPASEDVIGLQGNTNLYRKVGVVFLSVFVPINTGSRQAWTYADQLSVLFRGQELSGVRFRRIEFDEVGEDEGWFQVNLSIVVESDEAF